MSAESDKENLLNGLLPTMGQSRSPQSKRISNRNRSKSIGPGGFGDAPAKPSNSDRRKSAFVPAVKSILASREDEAKRKEARRKSLANRRVSFAPEATLHTWDVIEYMRDATTSSSSSSPRRNTSESPKQSPKNASRSRHEEDSASESPSTPPKQLDSPASESSPANQRDMHQRKRRRVSSASDGGSSPMSIDSGSSSDDGENFTESNEDTVSRGDDQSEGVGSDGSTSASARLEQALRQAATRAGTRAVDNDDDGEMSMELATDEVTAAFRPWIQTSARTTRPDPVVYPDLDQANVVHPAIRSRAATIKNNELVQLESEGSEEMSMDMTLAIGGILSKQTTDETMDGDATMDFTTVVGGGIKFGSNAQPSTPASGTKRRRSSAFQAPSSVVDSSGSPARRRKSLRRMSMNRRRSIGAMLGDETMDLTESLGGIQEFMSKTGSTPVAPLDETLGDGAMDFTVAVGGIKDVQAMTMSASEENLEDMSMEMTSNLGRIDQSTAATPSTTPKEKPGSFGDPTLSRPTALALPSLSPSPKKLSPSKLSPNPQAGGTSPRKSPRRSGRLTIIPMTPEQVSKAQGQELSVPHSQNRTDDVGEDGPKTPITYDADIIQRAQGQSPKVQESPVPLQLDSTPKASSLSQSIKSLLTPRKQAKTPLLKATTTPKTVMKQSPIKLETPKGMTPKKSPKKNVVISEPVRESSLAKVQVSTEGHVSLQEFLRLTNIRFLDLTTTKRRHTAAPSVLTKQVFQQETADDEARLLENSVVAGACTVPMLSLFQHSCHEMKHYISGGKDEVLMIEEEAYENQPPLFNEYMSAPAGERAIMDNQFKNMKSNARLQSKAGWYSWRMQLLTELMKSLKQTSLELDEDGKTLQQQEELMDSVLPGLIQRNDELKRELERLQDHAANFNDEDQEELEDARARIQGADQEIAEKKRLLAELQRSMEEKDETIVNLKGRKEECTGAIQVAERVREECRGWAADEVRTLKGRVDAITSKTGWTITSADANPYTLTMTYKSELELFLHPAEFIGSNEGSTAENQPISLSYIGDDPALRRPQPLGTTKRFFLQLLRAHLHSISQYQTTLQELLRIVSSGWDCADRVVEAVGLLQQLCITEEAILSDERLAIKVNMVLPNLQTKVRPVIVITAHITDGQVEVLSDVTASVVYGEKYDEAKMAEFLKVHMGSTLDRTSNWVESVLDLKRRLIKRGRKG